MHYADLAGVGRRGVYLNDSYSVHFASACLNSKPLAVAKAHQAKLAGVRRREAICRNDALVGDAAELERNGKEKTKSQKGAPCRTGWGPVELSRSRAQCAGWRRGRGRRGRRRRIPAAAARPT